LVLPNKRIAAQQRGIIELMCETGRNVPTEHPLALVLSGELLIIRIRHLEPGPPRPDVQMEYVCVVRLVIEVIEERLRITVRMQRLKLRRIQKPSAIETIDGKKISQFLPAVRNVKAQARRSKRAVAQAHAARRMLHAKA
jgi:hypothetical protein